MALPVFRDDELGQQLQARLNESADEQGLDGEVKQQYVNDALLLASIFDQAAWVLSKYGDLLNEGREQPSS